VCWLHQPACCCPLPLGLKARRRALWARHVGADAACVRAVHLPPDECNEFELTTDTQFAPGTDMVETKTYKVTFGQIYLSKPNMVEADGEQTTTFPHEARLRNLTCVVLQLHTPCTYCCCQLR
jgi:hypothetical protein